MPKSPALSPLGRALADALLAVVPLLEARILAALASGLNSPASAPSRPSRSEARAPASRQHRRMSAAEVDELLARVRGAFRRGEELGLAAITERVGDVDRKRLGRAIDALLEAKTIKRVGPAGRRYARYALR